MTNLPENGDIMPHLDALAASGGGEPDAWALVGDSGVLIATDTRKKTLDKLCSPTHETVIPLYRRAPVAGGEACPKCAELESTIARITQLKIEAEDGEPWKADATLRGVGVEFFASEIVKWYRDAGGVNYVEAKVIDPKTREMFALTVQRCEGKTPHELKLEAEAELAALRAPVCPVEATDTERQEAR